MKYEILKYLINHKDGAPEEFTNFLRKSFPNFSRKRVRDTLLALLNDELISGDKNSLIQVFMPREEIEKQMSDFPGNIIGWQITTAGERLYFDDEFRNQMKQVNDASIKASKSAVEVNSSIKTLNEEIIPRFNEFQRRTSILTLVVAGLSLVAIIFSAYYGSKSVTSEDVQALKQQLEKNTSILDSISTHEKGINSTLRKVANDTTHRKSH